MTTIDRYIVRNFLSAYVLLLAVFVGMYIFGDLLFNIDEFTENPALSAQEVLGNMFDYYSHNLPLYYQQLGGVMMCIAAGFTFAMMLRNNELVALVAAGVPLQRLAVPILVASAGLVTLWVANGELLVPAFAQKIVRQHDDLGDTRTVEVQCVRDNRNAILSATELYSTRGEMRQVYIIEPNDDGLLSYLIQADAAQYDFQRQTWVLDRGRRLLLDPAFAHEELGEGMRWESLAEFDFTLSPEQILLRQSSQWADLMSLRQMNALLETQDLPNLPAVAKARDIRFFQPLLAWILMLLSVPFFLTCAPGNVLVAGGKALLLAGGCFAFTFFAHSIPTGSDMMLLMTSLPVLVFGPVAVLHIFNVRT